MALNKEMFTTYFKYNEFDKCINMLRQEVKRIIVKKIQAINPEYQYTSLLKLKKDSYKYLSQIEQEILIELYAFSYSEEPESFELSRMMEIYKTLTT